MGMLVETDLQVRGLELDLEVSAVADLNVLFKKTIAKRTPAPLSELVFAHLVDSWFLKQQKRAERDLIIQSSKSLSYCTHTKRSTCCVDCKVNSAA